MASVSHVWQRLLHVLLFILMLVAMAPMENRTGLMPWYKIIISIVISNMTQIELLVSEDRWHAPMLIGTWEWISGSELRTCTHTHTQLSYMYSHSCACVRLCMCVCVCVSTGCVSVFMEDRWQYAHICITGHQFVNFNTVYRILTLSFWCTSELQFPKI